MRLPLWGKETAMLSDVAVASALVKETWQVKPGRNAKACIGAIFAAVKKVERRLPPEALRERTRQWTERRVETIWKKQAKRIDNYEMVDLEQAALEAAQGEFDESINRARRLAEFISAHEKTDRGAVLHRLRELVG